MIAAAHQPIFMPWPGLFYKALRADVLVLLDDVQFPQGRGWMTRNRLKDSRGELWLRVPVRRKGRGKQIIRDVEILEEEDWRRKHLESIRQHYAHAPYLAEFLPALETIYSRGQGCLLDLNLDIIRLLWEALGLGRRRLVLQSELGAGGGGTGLLVNVCVALNADRYVTLSPARRHIVPEEFAANGIEPEFLRFHPPVYPQLWGEARYNLSTLDLLLNCGPKSLSIIDGA